MRYPEILAIEPAPAHFAYDADYTILYALGLGAGATEDELPFVYEEGLRALPTMTVMMAQASGEILDGGDIDYSMIVHGEQRLTLHRPLPATGRMVSHARCASVVDKGRAKGALVNLESTVADAETGEPYASAVMTLFCRGDGGFDGPSDGALEPHPIPGRAHDCDIVLPTLPQQAAIYRLSGDKNPLHIDPAMARHAGFDRPILHGLCTYGIACRAILRAFCDNDPARIARFDARFAAPVFPGDAITTRVWRDGRVLSFECLVAERETTVIRSGLCLLRE